MVGKDLGDQAKGTGAYTGGGKGGVNFNASNTGGPTSVDRTRTTETQDYNTYKATGENPLNLDITRLREEGPTLTPQEILKKKNQNLFYKTNNTPNYIPSYLKIAANFNRTPNRKHFYNKVLKNNAANLNYTDLEKAYEEYMSNRMSGATDAYGNPIINNSGDNQQPYIPMNYNTAAAESEEEETIDYKFGDNQNVIYDQYGDPGYRTTAAEGGIMGTRARRAMGGIMNRIDQRQGFFLGGIGKAIGKIGKAAGKVLKSDIGKAAIAGAAFYYGGGGASMFKEAGLKGMAGNFFSKANPLLFNADKTLSLSKLAGISGVLPFLAGGAKPNETNFSKRGGQLIDPITGKEATPAEMRESIELAKLEAGNDADKLAAIDAKYNNMLNLQYQASLPDATPYNLYGSRGYRTTGAATGGRIGYNGGGSVITLMDGTKVQIPAGSYNSSGSLKDRIYSSNKGDLLREEIIRKLSFANGGRIGKAEGGLLDLGGMEKDYRAEGGFVPIGEYEKKDDVPARLSVNEFVMTADAVRGAGQGDIDKGAEIMENMMENLENGGTVSEESQGNKGARQMFETSERLGAVI